MSSLLRETARSRELREAWSNCQPNFKALHYTRHRCPIPVASGRLHAVNAHAVFFGIKAVKSDGRMVLRMCSIALLLLAHGVMHKGNGSCQGTTVDPLGTVELKQQHRLFRLTTQALETGRESQRSTARQCKGCYLLRTDERQKQMGE